MGDLSHRLSTATPEQQRELIEELWHIVSPRPGPSGDDATTHANWIITTRKVYRLLDCGAYLDAVMLMVPEGWRIVLDSQLKAASVYSYLNDPRYGNICTITRREASTLALALASAIAAAKGV